MEILGVTIFSDNLLETEHFYARVFGLSIQTKDTNSISFIAGKSILTFIKSSNLNPIYHFAFNIPHNRLEETIDWVSSKTSLIINENDEVVTDFKNWNAKAIYFHDNNGNILEFIARFDLDNDTDEGFSESSILSISEIGIVTESPIDYAEKLAKAHQLSFFKKGPKTEKFAALGDDNGLLIISKTKRHWYPTEVESERFYTQVRIISDGIISEIEVIGADI